MDLSVLNAFGPWGIIAGIALTIAAQRASVPGTILNRLFPKSNPFVPLVPVTPVNPAPEPVTPVNPAPDEALLRLLLASIRARFPWLSTQDAIARHLTEIADVEVSKAKERAAIAATKAV